MSLGIIVTLFTWMAHMLASSKRDTKNASAASCRHMMVLPWKCMSVLPTSLVQSHRLAVRRGVSELGVQCFFGTALDLAEGNCARLILPGLLYLSCFQELLLWGLAANGRAELPSGRVLPQGRWPSLCSHLGQLLGR